MIDPRHSSATIKCDECQRVFPVKTRSPSGARLAPEAGAQALRRAGWHNIEKNPVCPGCIEKRERTTMKEKNDVIPLRAEADRAPKAMTTEQRRTIFRAIDETYRGDLHRYCDGTTDHTIASRLQVPRAWVEKIREENFGPGGNDDLVEVEQKLAALAVLVTSATEQALLASVAAEEAAKGLKDAQSRLEALKAAVGPRVRSA